MTGCWLWTAAVDAHGYGRFNAGRKTAAGNPLSQHATHVSWELYVGTSRNGLDVLHRCDTPECVAPHHLFLGTAQDNVNDMIKKGRGKSGQHNKAKTHCKAGHPLSGDNLYFTAYNNGRHCRKCNARRQREATKRKEAKCQTKSL
jgi:hypothetical protein